jgi:hypothetical protein
MLQNSGDDFDQRMKMNSFVSAVITCNDIKFCSNAADLCSLLLLALLSQNLTSLTQVHQNLVDPINY